MRRAVIAGLFGLLIVAGVASVRFFGSKPRPPQPVARTETAPRLQPILGNARPAEPAPLPARPARRAAPRAAEAPAAPAAPEAAPDVGALRIDSDVPGAQVFIDREFIGAAPVTADNLKAGSHQLNVSAQGYEGFAETIEVDRGTRDVVVKFKEVRLNAAIDVVHKHRLGVCKGRLVATPHGIRYETTDKDDAFSGSLVDLETFQVDYLQKDLRVKMRKGKRYDFTDPDGNADRLFVFQRDVQKAVDRLRKGDAPASQ